MKKSELIEALEAATGHPKAAVAAVIDALPGVVLAALRNGGTLTLPGVAKFDVRKRAARQVRNPQTGAMMDKPASVVAAIKPAKPLKDAVSAFPAG